MDYIIYRIDCKERPWVRFSDGQIFLTGERINAEEELKREKEDGDAVIVSLAYSPFKEDGAIGNCYVRLGRKNIHQFQYTEDMYNSDDFFSNLEKNLPMIEKGISLAR